MDAEKVSENHDRCTVGEKDSYLGFKIIEDEAETWSSKQTSAYSTTALKRLTLLKENP